MTISKRNNPCVSDLAQVIGIFRSSKLSLYSFGDVPFIVAGLEQLLPDMTFITDLRDGLQDSSAPIRVIRPNTAHRGEYSRIVLLDALEAPTVCEALRQDDGFRALLILYQSDIELWETCRRKRLRVLSPHPERAREAEDKCNLSAILAGAGVPGIENEIVPTVACNEFSYWAARFGIPFVVQISDNDKRGEGTFFIAEAPEFTHTLERVAARKRIKISRFIRGFSINTSACATREGVAVARYFHQLVGLPQVTNVKGAHCGNDTASHLKLNEETLPQAYRATIQIGEELLRRGYRGAFGIDFVVDQSGLPHVIEINARLQSTTSILTPFQLSLNLVPLIALHILEHLNLDYRFDVAKYNERNWQRTTSDVSQIALFNLEGCARVREPLRHGIYRTGQPPVYLGPGYSLLDLPDKDCFLLTRALEHDQILKPNHQMYVMQFLRSVLEAPGKLYPWVEALCTDIRRCCCLEPS